jgi:hypothetical protein
MLVHVEADALKVGNDRLDVTCLIQIFLVSAVARL